MTTSADAPRSGGTGPGRRSLLLRVADWMFAPRTSRRSRPARWLLTQLGRAPERSELATDCRQCGTCDRVTVFRLGPRRARYWCQRCRAVVAVPDRIALRPVAELPDRSASQTRRLPPVDPAVREVLPAAMLAWLADRSELPTGPDQLDKPTIYQLYRRWDAYLVEQPGVRLTRCAVDGEPTPQPGLPAFSKVIGAVQDRVYRTELAVAVLTERFPEVTGAAAQAALWERAEHARRWLAGRGREWSWIHSRLPGGRLAEPDRAQVEAAVVVLQSGTEPAAASARAARAALFGTKAGPRLATLVQVYSRERLLAAIKSYLDNGARPLREDALARLTAPPASVRSADC